jgi:hypothetical protein
MQDRLIPIAFTSFPEYQISSLFGWLVVMAGAGLFWEKNTDGCLLMADFF